MLSYKFVGALTSKPFAFTFRSWEVTSKKFVDFLDILALDILIETRQHKIIRVLPLFSYDMPKNVWLNDRIRHFLPTFNKYRLFKINFLYKITANGLNRKYLNINRKESLSYLTGLLFSDNTLNRLDILSNPTSFENSFRLKTLTLAHTLTARILSPNKQVVGMATTAPTRSDYLLLESINNFFNFTDLLCIGLDLRKISDRKSVV